jgi:hypothetical protein
MTPNFALGLTEHGITLWQRDGDGWLRMGAVPMDAPDLEDQMQALVAKAKAASPDEITTKLVIPDDQILYTHLPVQGDDSRVRAALDGKTPYPVEELDFDYIPQGDGVLAAVVARETLIEAEDFATAQGLNPVCFVAAPQNHDFVQEPFFKTARGVRLDPTDLGRGGPILRETGLFQTPKPAAADPAEDTAAKPEAPSKKDDAPKSPETKEQPAEESSAQGAKDSAGSKVDAPKPSVPSTATSEQPATPAARSDTVPATGSKGAEPVSASKAVAPGAEAPSFRSRRAAPTAPAAANPPRAAAQGTRTATATKATKPAVKSRAFSLGNLGGEGLVAKLRSSLGAPASRAGNGLRSATDLLGRKLTPKPTPETPAAPKPAAARPAAAAPPPAKPKQAAGGAKPSAPTSAPKASGAGTTNKAASLVARTTGAGPGKKDPEAERLTVFGARRGDTSAEPSLPKRALLISGAALMLVLAVAIWAFYFSRAGVEELAQPVLPETTTTEVAAPDPLTLPDPDPATDERAEIEAALGATDAAQEQGGLSEETPSEPMSAEATTPTVTAPQADAGRLAALRSVRAIAPEASGSLPSVQAAPAPFGSTPLPPLREDLAAVSDTTTPEAEVAPAPEPPAPALPEGEEALEIVVTQGRPAAVPPARPAGIAPEPAPEPEAALPADATPDAIADAVADATAVAEQAAQELLAPLDESSLVIDITEGSPAVTPPERPEGIAPEPVADTPVNPATETETDTPDTTEDSAVDPDQARLTPPPGGVALTLISPAPRPAEIVEEATARAEQFATATPQAVVASLRPSNRPNGFSQTVQRALAAARVQQAAPPAAEPQIVQASAASVAPRIPSSASVASAATQTRAINLRQVNLLGVMGTPSARRALVRLDNGRVVTVRVGERLDGGQVTAIGDSELRYTRRGRDVVLRIAS